MKQLLITIAAVVLVGCGPRMSIHEAADEGNIEEVKQHLDSGIDVNAKNQFGATPLHFAAKQGHKNLAALLITEGADTNAEAYDKSTPLHSAVISGYKEVAEQLIANGADVNAKGYESSTPLDNAIEFKHLDTAALLRKHGWCASHVQTHQQLHSPFRHRLNSPIPIATVLLHRRA